MYESKRTASKLTVTIQFIWVAIIILTGTKIGTFMSHFISKPGMEVIQNDR